jgi:hypothetical protein
MFELVKLSETCYLCDEVGLAIVNQMETSDWFVIDKGTERESSKVVFGPSGFEQCRVFIESVFLGETE